MFFVIYQLKTSFLINFPRLQKHTVGPEGQFLVTAMAGKMNTLFNQVSTQAQTSCARFYKQETEFGNCVAALYQKYRADKLSIHLCNPATLFFRIILLDKVCYNLRNQGLKLLIPAICLCI